MSKMDEKFLKPYDPISAEKNINKMWEDSGFYNPDKMIEKGIIKEEAKPFSVILPPPNVTGTLHLGHSLMVAIQDTFVRYHRMMGKKTLWLPGTDHAAIATQSKVEKEISKKEGKSRYDIGREEMLKRIDEFAQNSHDTIVTQIKAMGASLDWSREAFTLDETRNKAVNYAFKKMYEDGLIVRKHRIVNWDPKGQTTISDDEIIYEERKAKMYTFKYSHDFPIAISTTRPETKIGDVAVAVHPDDIRYKEFVGKTYQANFCGVPIEIKIIADESVEKDFGTGALGVTPAHRQIDWEIADRHDLPRPQVINEYAKIMIGDERLLNKKVTEAREIIVDWLKTENLLLKEEEINQNVSTAERTGAIIEPLPKLQWFIDVNKKFKIENSKITGISSGSETSLKELMRQTINSKQIEVIPEYFDKTYFHWIDNLRDWCISRQIWYGHRIPVWYKDQEIFVGEKAPEENGWEQDPDTLDTWFSSGMWTFSTLGWSEETADLKNYHPTQLMETGYDILFFWVARMILMSGYLLGDIPFEKVYLHGLVRDGQGRKISKSLGNSIDPIEIIEKFGADALRMALITGTAPGTDSKISDDKIKGYKHFANKIWNIARFILQSTGEIEFDENFSNWSAADLELIQKRDLEINETQKEIEDYKIYIASERLYKYIWHELADVIIEDSKSILSDLNSEQAISRAQFLLHTLNIILRALHPFMPFVTEEIWSSTFKKDSKPLMIESWNFNQQK
jgi:valyl-tRNA synthetase